MGSESFLKRHWNNLWAKHGQKELTNQSFQKILNPSLFKERIVHDFKKKRGAKESIETIFFLHTYPWNQTNLEGLEFILFYFLSGLVIFCFFNPIYSPFSDSYEGYSSFSNSNISLSELPAVFSAGSSRILKKLQIRNYTFEMVDIIMVK